MFELLLYQEKGDFIMKIGKTRIFSRLLYNITQEKVYKRILSTFVIFYLLFFIVVILSYFLLPEGFLKSKNSISDFEASKNIGFQALQIFSYNCISVVLLIVGNFLSPSKEDGLYLPYGYLGLMVQFILNGITLGTWSFTEVTQSAPALSVRLLRTFDIFHKAGIWEMTGQIIIVSALANIAIIRTNCKETTNRKRKEWYPTKIEIVIAFFGLSLMIAGAIIESMAILS